jgi:nicotinamide-nucleotide amidase
MFFDILRKHIVSFFRVDLKESTELSTFLIPEAVLEDVCAELRPPGVEWRTRFQPHKISLYLEGGTVQERELFIERLKSRFGEELVREGQTEAFRAMSDAARERGFMIAAAESCTGGLFSTLVTDLPGSSDIFWGGLVTYADGAKTGILGVEEAVLREHGAVSRKTVEEMTQGVLSRSGADVAVAISGVAGPSGGTAEKPVGTVWFAVASEEVGVRAWKMNLGSRRDIIRRRSAVAAALCVETAIRMPGSLDRVEKWNYS